MYAALAYYLHNKTPLFVGVMQQYLSSSFSPFEKIVI
jgi:hypothetical protein